MIDMIIWFFSNIGIAFYNFFYAVTHPGLWLDWSDKQSLMRFIYYGASQELFFVVFDAFVILTGLGLWRRQIMWGVVRALEAVNNSVGRFAAWAGLLMVTQQIVIIFLQRIFRVADISVGPFGWVVKMDLSWYGEELKFYNAIIVALACGYTFIQGGHVRVDLFYASARFRTKKVIDMFGSLFFMIPAMTLIWLYAWNFMWRHMITPKVSASDKLELMLRKARIVKWHVETIGFSPNGFNGYFLFKVLLVAFTFLMFVQAIAFFYRSLLEYREGPESAGKYLDKDKVSDDLDEAVSEVLEEAHF